MRLIKQHFHLILLLLIFLLIHAIDIDILLNDSLVLETYDLNTMKGIMKRQNLKISFLHNPLNDWHSCYQVICQGNGCPEENAYYRFCYPSIIITGLPKCGTTAMYDLLARYSGTILMSEKENCPYAHRRPHWQFFNSLPSFDKITEGKLIIDGCIQAAPNMIMRKHLRQPKTLYLIMTRNYADMLWSSYNFWCRWDVDGGTCDSSRWATVGLHVRSNHLFHDIIQADKNGTLYVRVPESRTRMMPNPNIKNPLFISKPCHMASGFFHEFLELQIWRHVHRNSTLVIASEELEINPYFVWRKIATFFHGLNHTQFQLGNFTDTRFNTQDPTASKGQSFLMAGVPKSKYKPGVFAISNYQPMLNETRSLLNECWFNDCLLISQITGYLYDVCKDEAINLIKIGKFHSFREIYFASENSYNFDFEDAHHDWLMEKEEVGSYEVSGNLYRPS